MENDKNTQTDVNDSATSGRMRTPLTQPRSGPVLFELVGYRGEIFGPYTSAEEAGEAAKMKWPDQEQDPDRTGAGWDVQVWTLKD